MALVAPAPLGAAPPPQSWVSFGLAAASKTFEMKCTVTTCVQHDIDPFPVSGMSSACKNVCSVLWFKEFPAPVLAVGQSLEQWSESVQEMYKQAVGLYGQRNAEGDLDYRAYASALRAMPLPLHLDPEIGIAGAFVEFVIRDSRISPAGQAYELVVLLTNLPRLSYNQVSKLVPDLNCLIKAAPDPDRQNKTLWAPTHNAKAAHLLLEYLGGDVFLMRTVVEQKKGKQNRPIILAENAAEYQAELTEAFDWVAAHAHWDDEKPSAYVTWYNTQRLVEDSPVALLLGRGIPQKDIDETVKAVHKKGSRAMELVVDCPLRYPQHFELTGPDLQDLKRQLDRVQRDAEGGAKAFGLHGHGKGGKTAFNLAVMTGVSAAKIEKKGERLRPGVHCTNDKDVLGKAFAKRDRLDVYGLQLDDPIRLHAWSAGDWTAFGNILAAGNTSSARNSNGLLPKGWVRCYSTNLATHLLAKGQPGELDAIRNKLHVVDLYKHAPHMRLSTYYEDDEGFSPPTILTEEGELLFRQWLQVPDAEKKLAHEPRRKAEPCAVPPAAGAVAHGARAGGPFDATQKAVVKRALAMLELTPDSKKRHLETLGITP